MVPLTPKLSYDEVKQFSQTAVMHMARTIPSRFVSKSGGSNRAGKIFIDYLRNGHGQTTAAAFSARASRHGCLDACRLGTAQGAEERLSVDHSHSAGVSVAAKAGPLGCLLEKAPNPGKGVEDATGLRAAACAGIRTPPSDPLGRLGAIRDEICELDIGNSLTCLSEKALTDPSSPVRLPKVLTFRAHRTSAILSKKRSLRCKDCADETCTRVAHISKTIAQGSSLSAGRTTATMSGQSPGLHRVHRAPQAAPPPGRHGLQRCRRAHAADT